MSTDLLDADLRAALERLAAAPEVSVSADPFADAQRRVHARQVKRRLRVGITVAAAITIAAVLTVALRPRNRDSTQVRVGGSHPPAVATVPLPGGVRILDAGPLAPRRNAAVAWVGRELVVWGGYVNVSTDGRTSRSYTDGAAYDPITGQWRAMATGPLPGGDAPAVATAAGTEVVIARGSRVAAWNPERNAWRTLAPAPGPVEDLEALSGHALISASANAILDLHTGRWHVLPKPPVSLVQQPDQLRTIWTGRDLIVVGEHGASQLPVVLSYRPGTDHWRTRRSPTDLSANAVAIAWTGHEVVALDYQLHVETYNPNTDTWSPLPPVPARVFEWFPATRALRSTVTAFLGNSVAVLNGDRPWTVLPYRVLGFEPQGLPGAAPATAATDSPDRFFVYGLTKQGTNALALVDPQRLATSSEQIQVGVATVTLPTGTRVGNWTTDINPTRVRLFVDLATPTGACQVGSAEPQGPGATTTPGTWTSDATGRNWTIHATSTDTVDVSCESATTARQLVDRTQVPGATP